MLRVPQDAGPEAGEGMRTETEAERIAGVVCYRCKKDGKPLFASKGGGSSVIHVPKVTWWHNFGEYTIECKMAQYWTELDQKVVK